jgi:hypothetical protein
MMLQMKRLIKQLQQRWMTAPAAFLLKLPKKGANKTPILGPF